MDKMRYQSNRREVDIRKIKKKFQMRRILAMVLTVTVFITMLPVTVNAVSFNEVTSMQKNVVETEQVKYTLSDRWGEAEKSVVYNEKAVREEGTYEEIEKAFYESIFVITQKGAETKETVLGNASDCITFWQQRTGVGNEDKDYTDMGKGEQPTRVGDYRLVVIFPDGTVNKEIDFTVTPAPVYPNVKVKNIVPGTLQEEVDGESLIQSLYFTGADDYGSRYPVYFTTDLSGFEVNEDGEPQFIAYPAVITAGSVQITNAATGRVLKKGEVLSTDQDYFADITFRYVEGENLPLKVTKANYNLQTTKVPIRFEGLANPIVDVQLLSQKSNDDQEDMPAVPDNLTYTYTGKPIAAPIAGKDYTVKVRLDEQAVDKNGNPIVDKDGNIVYKEVDDAKLTTGWYSEQHGYWDGSWHPDYFEHEKDKMDTAPVEAGTYYYVFSYEGKRGVYNRGYGEIKVVIQPAEVTIVPKADKNQKFYEGMTKKEILETVSCEVLDADGKHIDINWGVYANRKYEPTLCIEKKVTENMKDIEDVEDTAPYYRPLVYGEEIKRGEEYRIRFTGKKCYEHYDPGSYSYCWNDIDINAPVNFFNTNYAVNTNDLESVNNKNVILFKVDEGPAASAVIDVTDLYQNGKGTNENPITKVYGEDPFYHKRTEYKKAKVVGNDGTVLAQNTDSSLSYKWECIDYYEEVIDPVTNEIVERIPKWSTWYGICPEDVGYGYYRLVISYRDKTHSYYAKNEEIYYKIEPQKFKIVPTKVPSAFYGGNIGSYIENADFEYEFWTVLPSGKGKKLDWTEGKDYEEIYWEVQKKDSQKNSWESVGYDETFEENVSYRIRPRGIYFIFWEEESNYIDYETIIEGETEKRQYFHEAKEIIPKKMGDIALKVEAASGKKDIIKVYDGEGINIADYFADGSIKILTVEDHTDVTAEILQSEDFSVKWWSTYNYIEEDYWGDENLIEEGFVQKPINGGQYDLWIDFRGSEKYRGFSDHTSVTAQITPLEIQMELPVQEPVAAGSVLTDSYDKSKIEFTGWAPADEQAFTYQNYQVQDNEWTTPYYTWGWPAIEHLSVTAYGEDGSVVASYNDKFKGGMEYQLKCESISLRRPYTRNYRFNGAGTAFKTVRGSSNVEGTSITLNHNNKSIQLLEVGVYDKIKNSGGKYTHTITPMGGVPYYSKVWNASAGKDQLGEIQNGHFIAVKIILPAEYDEIYDGGMTFFENNIKNAGGFVAWEAMKNTDGIIAVFNVSAQDIKEFDIQWAEGYVEHFVLDFTRTELLANLEQAVAPKSISFHNPKKKMVVGDEQQLDVKLTKVKESDIIYLTYHVDEAGKGIVCIDEKGYVTALAPGKAAITVYASRRDEKGKPEIIKPEKKASVTITVTDVTAPKIKKINVTDTRAQIQFPNMNDGWRLECYVLEGSNRTEKEFEEAIALDQSLYRMYEWSPTICVGNVGKPEFYNKNTQYINIWGLKADSEYTVYMRNLSKIRALEDGCEVGLSVRGVVKNFKTTIPQIKSMTFDYMDGEDSKIKWNKETETYEVDLKEKTVPIKVSGSFGTMWDAEEEIWRNEGKYSLPLSKEQRGHYINPKLSYTVSSDTPSIAAIDKKGNLKLKGVGRVRVTVKDLNTNVECAGYINITANADSIEGKNIKLQVGQAVGISELVTYKENGKVLNGNYLNRNIAADERVKEAVEKQEEYFKLVGNTIVAIKDGGILSLNLKDELVGDMEAVATIQSTVLDPIKNLKASVVTDQYIDLEFTHNGFANAFRVKVTDASGDLLRSTYLPKNNAYNPATGKFSYRIYGLTKKSKYHVAVTALYADSESKEVRKAFTTTLLPASYESVSGNENGGVGIKVVKAIRCQEGGYMTDMKDIRDDGLLIAGNTYTLVLDGDKLNDGSKYAVTDKLTWSSTNTKAATVQANPGTYTASLKAIKSGTTTIAVRSQITKAVVAQWTVYVNPVGTADGYYGENEQLGRNGKGRHNKGGLLANVSAESGRYQRLRYTAKVSGEYRFYSTGDDDPCAWFFGGEIPDSQSKGYLDFNKIAYDDDGGEGYNFSCKKYLTKGQTIYIAVGSYDLSKSVECDVYVQLENEKVK